MPLQVYRWARDCRVDSINVALRTAEMAVVFALSAALLAFSRGPRRRVLRYWAGAGAAFIAREWAMLRLERAPDVRLMELFPTPLVAQVGEHALLVLLVAGAMELRQRESVSRKGLTLSLAIAAVLAVVAVSIPGLTVAQALVWRGGVAVLCALALMMAVAIIARATAAAPTVGQRVLLGVMPLLALERMVTGYHAMAVGKGWPTSEGFLLMPMVELALLTVGVVATVVMLLEAEQVETREGRSAAARAEQALLDSQAYFRELIDGASDIVTVLDEAGTILFESPAVERLLGWHPDENRGRPATSLVHPEDQPAVTGAIQRVVARVETGATAKYRYRRKDGEYRWLESNGREIEPRGADRRFVVNTRDVTEREQLEEQLIHVQRIESLGRFAGGVAHDFNNLLTVIMSNTALAKASMPAAHPALRELEEVTEAAARAAGLTSQLLAFARGRVVELQWIELNALTTGLLQMLHRLVGEQVTVEVDLWPDGLPLLGDSSQLERALVNLVVNAKDAMPGGGTVTIRTAPRVVEDGERIGGANLAPGEYVTLSVTDTGTGIAAEHRALIFEPFFTTKPPGHGTGLGLATCYGIVKRHGGHIWCHGAEGRGTVFIVCLPASRPPARAASVLEVRDLAELRGTERVLLVEDDHLVRGATRRILTEFGYSVDEAEDAAHAFRQLASLPFPDLIMTDVVMPGMDGLAFAAQLRANGHTVPIILASGYSEHPHDVHRAVGGNTRFLRKPFSPRQLLEIMRRLLDEREHLVIKS
jgi:PAS domain S-box-containing protein